MRVCRSVCVRVRLQQRKDRASEGPTEWDVHEVRMKKKFDQHRKVNRTLVDTKNRNREQRFYAGVFSVPRAHATLVLYPCSQELSASTFCFIPGSLLVVVLFVDAATITLVVVPDLRCPKILLSPTEKAVLCPCRFCWNLLQIFSFPSPGPQRKK